MGPAFDNWKPYVHVTGTASRCCHGIWSVSVRPTISSAAVGLPSPSVTYLCDRLPDMYSIQHGHNQVVKFRGSITGVIFYSDYEEHDQHIIALTVDVDI